MRIPKPLLSVMAVAVAGFVAVSAFFAWQLTKPSRRVVGDPPPALAIHTDSVNFAARDGLKLLSDSLDGGALEVTK